MFSGGSSASAGMWRTFLAVYRVEMGHPTELSLGWLKSKIPCDLSNRRETQGICKVDLIGLEPTTSSMPWKRSPN